MTTSSDYETYLVESGIDPSTLAKPTDEDPDEFVNTGIKQFTMAELDAKIENEVKGFSDLLSTLSSTEDRKKALWKQIYEFALVDRKNAFVLFGDLYNMVQNNGTEHAIHGATLSKYMERMQKANEQLIKLAELVSEAIDEQVEESWSEDDMYEMMNKSSKKN
jgi:hypothetical protein